jgi:hypothetical protein
MRVSIAALLLSACCLVSCAHEDAAIPTVKSEVPVPAEVPQPQTSSARAVRIDLSE